MINTRFSIYSNYNHYQAPSFKGLPDKLAQKLLKATNPELRKLPVTFEEAAGLYEKMGFEITKKGGSHAIVSLPDTDLNFPLPIPHHGEKKIVPIDVKRLKDMVLVYYKND